MAQVKQNEEQELWDSAEVKHSVVQEFKQEPEFREIQSLDDTSSILHCTKEEPEEVEIKAEPLPQFLFESVKSEEGEPQSSLLHRTVTEENREDTDAAGASSDHTDDSEDWDASVDRPTSQTQRRERSDSESSFEFNPPPTKTRTKRPMEDLTASVCGKNYWTFPKKRPFKCPVCEKGFITRTHLNRHVSSHTGEYTWKCSICSEVFRQEGHLRLHKRRHDTEQYCPVCSKRFTSLTHVEMHIRTHSGEKPYRCSACGIKFAQQGSLTRHKKAHPECKQIPTDS